MHLLTRILAVCALLAATVPLTTTATSADAAATVDPATLALDFGSEWLKGCLANQKASSIGSHLDVVIDSQSARKTPNLLGFDAADERILGDAALSLLFRTPARVFPHVKRLIGRTLQDPVVQQFQRDFPALELSSDAERGTVVFAKKGGDVSVEEVVVMLLQLAQRQAYNHVAANAEPADIQPVKGVVLTVPEHFSSAQRRLFAQLTELAGFEAPKATLGELTAVAIDYAVRNLPIAAEPSKVAFLSAGTMGVSATSFEMQRTESKITIRALKTASDATVGGYSIDLLVRDVLAKRFDASGKAGAASITTNPRAMAKLLRESRDLKEMLSASPVIEVQMAELFGGRDFKTSMTQEELNGLIADLVGKLISPLRTILEGETGVTGIEMFGGSVRTPSVQVAIKSAFPSIPLGKHVDGEESAVIGAAHYAGVLTNIAKLIRVEVDESAVAPQTSDADTKLVLTAEQQRVLGEKIAALDAKAEARRIADAARNTLESTLNDARDLIASGKVPKGKKDELVALESLIAESSTFVEDSDAQTTAAAFNEKHTTLLAALDPLRPVKKAEPTKPEKPSAPRKKRDRRAEYAKAQEEAKRQEKQRARDADKAKAKATKTKAQDNKKASKETKKVPAKDKKKATKEEEKQRSKSNKRDREEL